MTDQDVTGRAGSGSETGHSSQAGLIAGGVVGLVLCAVVGGLGGYLLAGDGPGASNEGAGPAATTTAQGTPTKTPRGTPPRPPSRTPASKPAIDGDALPDLKGQDFESARDQLRDRGLGVDVVFEGGGSDRSVDRTDPAGGTTVRRGTTVKIFVAGAAPSVVVPQLIGESCSAGARQLGAEGLFPRYPTGKDGRISQQSPQPGSTVPWNGVVQLYCGDEVVPSGTPTS